jgi:hypothetical protein
MTIIMHRYVLAAAAVILLVSPAEAVDFGWQPLSEGGIEYQVQIEPQLVDSFRREGYTSEVPPGLRDIRRIHITVGSERLPNQGDLQGPKVTKATPPASDTKSDSKVVEQSLPPAQPQTFGETEPKREVPQTDDTTKKTATESPPPLLDSSRPVTLPFFQSAPAKKVASETADTPEKPKLKPYEGPAIAVADKEESSRSHWKSVEAGMPATPGSSGSPSNSPPVAVSKPWGVLMFVLLVLFASLGANVYLAWIHQEVRLKYRALVTEMHGGSAAA